MTHDPPMEALEFQRIPEDEMRKRAREYLEELSQRRSIRHFSSEPVPLDVIRDCIAAAGTAPSGAHKQPWHFVLVTDPSLKTRIRVGAEKEEREFYDHRASERWLQDLQPMGTHASKPMLEEAPALIVVFAQVRGENQQHYYVQESVGIAVGFLLSGLHRAGLAALPHTPSPMGFLREILDRPAWERAYLLIPVGYPVAECQVPDLERKTLDQILTCCPPQDP
jgi:iodotyrosine deiodinase